MLPPQGMKNLMDYSAFGLTAKPNRNGLSSTNTSNVGVTPESIDVYNSYIRNWDIKAWACRWKQGYALFNM